MRSPQGMGTLGGGGSLPLGQHHTGTGVKNCHCPTPNAGLAPSAALTDEILSETEQASVCPWRTYPPGGSVGAESPRKPQSPRQGRAGRDSDWDWSSQTCFPPRRPGFQRPG